MMQGLLHLQLANIEKLYFKVLTRVVKIRIYIYQGIGQYFILPPETLKPLLHQHSLR